MCGDLIISGSNLGLRRESVIVKFEGKIFYEKIIGRMMPRLDTMTPHKITETA